MAIQDKTTLKTYFETGDIPTEAQFGDLIDSNLNLTDGGTVTGDVTFNGVTTVEELNAKIRVETGPTYVPELGEICIYGGHVRQGDGVTEVEICPLLNDRFCLFDMFVYYPEAVPSANQSTFFWLSFSSLGSVIDFSLGVRNANKLVTFQTIYTNGSKPTKILGAKYLTSIKDAGTAQAFSIAGYSLNATEIDKFFTELPSTSLTATLNVSGNPGSATCTPSIATNKGYTVIT